MMKFDALSKAIDLLAEERKNNAELEEKVQILENNIHKMRKREEELLHERAFLMSENFKLRTALRRKGEVTLCL